MKLIVRSSYWGNTLKGKPRVDPMNPTRNFRTISSQAVVSVDGQRYWGCCQNSGKRVLDMTEQHFMDCYPGDWDLYLVGSVSTENNAIHTFFLLPRNQNCINIDHKTLYNGWHFYGTVSAENIRNNLGDLLSATFRPNENIGFRYHHVHIEILMHHVVDYASKEKKAKAKAEIDDSTATGSQSEDETPKTDVDSKKTESTPVPPVVKSESFDAASWTTDATSPLTCETYQEVPSNFIRSNSFDQEMICYPVAMPYMMHPSVPPPYPHQILPHHNMMSPMNDPHYQNYAMMNGCGMPIPVGMAVPPAPHLVSPYINAYDGGLVDGGIILSHTPPPITEWQEQESRDCH